MPAAAEGLQLSMDYQDSLSEAYHHHCFLKYAGQVNSLSKLRLAFQHAENAIANSAAKVDSFGGRYMERHFAGMRVMTNILQDPDKTDGGKTRGGSQQSRPRQNHQLVSRLQEHVTNLKRELNRTRHAESQARRAHKTAISELERTRQTLRDREAELEGALEAGLAQSLQSQAETLKLPTRACEFQEEEWQRQLSDVQTRRQHICQPQPPTRHKGRSNAQPPPSPSISTIIFPEDVSNSRQDSGATGNNHINSAEDAGEQALYGDENGQSQQTRDGGSLINTCWPRLVDDDEVEEDEWHDQGSSGTAGNTASMQDSRDFTATAEMAASRRMRREEYEFEVSSAGERRLLLFNRDRTSVAAADSSRALQDKEWLQRELNWYRKAVEKKEEEMAACRAGRYQLEIASQRVRQECEDREMAARQRQQQAEKAHGEAIRVRQQAEGELDEARRRRGTLVLVRNHLMHRHVELLVAENESARREDEVRQRQYALLLLLLLFSCTILSRSSIC